jgi:hypothetical protein
MQQRRNGRVQWQMSQVPYRVWHDLRFKDLHRSGKEFELMERAMGFAALGHAHRVPAARRRRCRQESRRTDSFALAIESAKT